MERFFSSLGGVNKMIYKVIRHLVLFPFQLVCSLVLLCISIVCFFFPLGLFAIPYFIIRAFVLSKDVKTLVEIEWPHAKKNIKEGLDLAVEVILITKDIARW